MIRNIDIEYDRALLRRDALDMAGYEPFVDPKTGNIIEKWLIKRQVGNYATELVCKFEEMLKCSIKPRFYIQEKGFTLPPHVDRGTTCAVNFVLSTRRDPITFHTSWGYMRYTYETAIVDVTQEHEVTAVNEDRVLFKMSIFDKSFEEVIERYERQ